MKTQIQGVYVKDITSTFSMHIASTKYKVILTLIVVFSYTHSFSQWNNINVGTSDNLYSVDYFSSNVTWIGSNNQFIKTNNNGSSWTVVNPMYDNVNQPILCTLYDIVLTDPTTAITTGLFFIGNNELILKTTNGGGNWDLASSTIAGSFPRVLNEIDANGSLMITVGKSGRVARSTNAGSTWAFIGSGTNTEFYDVKFASADTVYVSGTDRMLKSVNGGITWSVTTLNGNLYSLCVAPNVIYVAKNTSSLCKSVDQGATYTQLGLPFTCTGLIYNRGNDTLLAVGSNDFYKSVNGGLYWEKFNIPNYQTVNKVDFLDADNVIAVGNGGYAIRANNFSSISTYPMATFYIPGTGPYCLGDSITLNNTTTQVPWYTYEWKIDNVTFSTQYTPSLTLSTDGIHTISLIVSNGINTDTVTQQITVTGHNISSFSMVAGADTVCNGSYAGFTVPNSQYGTSYRLREGYTNQGVAQNGNGGSLFFASTSVMTSTTGFNIVAIRNNYCFVDSLIQYDTAYVKPALLDYFCSPIGTNLYGISNVSFNGINNSTAPILAYYSDYSCMINTDLVVGNTYPVSIITNHYGYCSVWLNFDNDNNFFPNELVFTGTTNDTLTGNITIPTTHQLFNVPIRMRVGFKTYSTPYTCGSGGDGEYEDYAVTIVPAPVLPIAIFNFSTTTTCGTKLVFNNNTFNATSYIWDFGDGDTSTLLNPIHTFSSSGTYLITLVATNYLGSDTISQIVTVQNPLVPVPSVCDPTAYIFSCNNNRVITSSIQLNGIDVYGGGTALGVDYMCTAQTRLQRGSSYVLSYSIRDQVNNCTGHASAWIDYNNDGLFNETDERLVPGDNINCPANFVTITVPNSAVTNVPLRFRIVTSDMNIPVNCLPICGQYLDFTVFVDTFPSIGVNFTPSTNVACQNTPISFSNLTVNAVNYFWEFGDGATSTLMNPTHSYSASGNYTVKLKACNSAGNCDSIVNSNFIINPGPPISIAALSSTTFCRGDSALLSASPLLSNYQWYNYGNLIAGATNMTYTAKSRGKFKCKTQDSIFQCLGVSNMIVVNVPCIPLGPNHQKIDIDGELDLTNLVISPNPGTGVFEIFSPPGHLQLFNSFGELVYSKKLFEVENEIDISELSDGIYFIQLKTENSTYYRKLILSH